MDKTLEDFFHDFRQNILVGSETNQNYQLAEFMEAVANELGETGVSEGFNFCSYRAQKGMRVDGFWFNDDGVLDLFIADFDNRTDISSLSQTEIDLAFKRLNKFFVACMENNLFSDLEETSIEYGLAREIHDRKKIIRKVNFFLISERNLSARVKSIDDSEYNKIAVLHHIWDMARLHRQSSARGQKEELNINFEEMFHKGIACLPAHTGVKSLQSYLVVMPGSILAALYEKYDARLLEQNVRCFLQARGKVNKGIRTTIMTEPEMFFAYNNGITATAIEVETKLTKNGLEITSMKDFQIVNGGQTTASLFHTKRKEKVSLEDIFVQMKLSVVDSIKSEEFVPRISEFANTQNKVNAADFFSNHPFHVRMEEFSRRVWAPANKGAQRETKWFYERVRGQYADASSKMTQGETKRFQAENPKPQMFTKTDIAKFENVWDDDPKWVNLGNQKNFAQYATRTGIAWKKNPDEFNELYFKRAVARAICFRTSEKLVSAAIWYNGGYRANIVAYTLSVLAEYCRLSKSSINFEQIWKSQSITPTTHAALEVISKFVNDDLIDPPPGFANVTQWAKRDDCWKRLKGRMPEITRLLSKEFKDELLSTSEMNEENTQAKKIQKIDNGIDAQKRVLEINPNEWLTIKLFGERKKLFSHKEIDIINIASKIPKNLPSEKQSLVLMDVLEKAETEGILVKIGIK